MQINLKASERFFVLFCPDSSDIEYKPTGLQSTDWSVKRFYPECSFLFLPIELGWQLQCKLKLISLSFYLLRLRALSWLGLPGTETEGLRLRRLKRSSQGSRGSRSRHEKVESGRRAREGLRLSPVLRTCSGPSEHLERRWGAPPFLLLHSLSNHWLPAALGRWGSLVDKLPYWRTISTMVGSCELRPAKFPSSQGVAYPSPETHGCWAAASHSILLGCLGPQLYDRG